MKIFRMFPFKVFIMTICSIYLSFFNKRIISIIYGLFSVIAVNHLFAATLQVGNASVILMAGQTIEITLYSSKPISGDLTARGAFQSGDVLFTPGPGCHLSAHGCTLMITAAPSSQRYTAVPVVVSESGANNKPVFALSVIRPGEPAPVKTKLPEVVSTPHMLSDEIGSELTFTFTNTTASVLNNLTAVELPIGVSSSICPTVAPNATCTLKLVVNDVAQAGDSVIAIQSEQGVLQNRILSLTTSKKIAHKPNDIPSQKPEMILTAGNLSATIIPHSLGSQLYTSSSNGPVYQMLQVTNNGGSSVTLDTPVIDGTNRSSFTIDTTASDYAGSPIFCNNAPTLSNGQSCEIIITSQLGDPTSAPATATLTISDGAGGDTLTFNLIDTTYVYAGGGFNALGNTSVSGGGLLAQCTANTCTNALQGNMSDNFSSTYSGVGQWINAMTVTSTGNLIVGGVFGAIGGATTGTSSNAALLAQCIPGAVAGNACFNQLGSSSNSNVSNNAYIDAITAPFLISSSNFIVLGGDFSQIKGASSGPPSNRLLARCSYSGVTAGTSCISYMGSRYANQAIAALNTLGSSSSSPLVNTGGLFTQIAGYPGSPPSTGSTFARCTNGSCSGGMTDNHSILGMSDDGTSLLMGGTFNQITG